MNIRLLILVLCLFMGSARAAETLLSTGTGFYITSTKIVTCAHCVPKEATKMIAVFSDQTKDELSVVFTDEKLDIALLSTKRKAEEVIAIGDSESTKLLDDLYVFGFPFATIIGGEISATQGKLNSRREMGGNQVLQLDATINPGNSGGPIVNASGHLIGIAVSRLDALKMAKESGTIPERVNFAIPSSVLRIRLTRANQPFQSPSVPVADLTPTITKATVLLLAMGEARHFLPEAAPPIQPVEMVGRIPLPRAFFCFPIPAPVT